MTVTLSVSQVQDELYRADRSAQGRGEGSPSTAMLGSWFHEWLAGLIGNGDASGSIARLPELGADLDLWKQTLIAEAYASYLGPRLTRHQAALHEQAPQVAALWRAMAEACGWLAELSWSVRPKNASRRHKPPAPWNAISDWFESEEAIACELREPPWSEKVQLVGLADALIRLPDSGKWCVIEFKLGRSSPAVDLGQVCLYDMILSQALGPGKGGGDGTLALVSFGPERTERLFPSDELAEARARLLELIGRLAQVSGDSRGQDNGTRIQPPPQSSNPYSDLRQGLAGTFAEYGVAVTVEDPIVGPTFIRFPITLGKGTTVKKVEKYPAEMQVHLKLDEEPLIRRDGGELAIDVQRPDRQTIHFEQIEEELLRRAPTSTNGAPSGGSAVPVGIDLHRSLFCADLSQPENSHILVAGTTGSGKSEWLRTAIAGLTATNTPGTLRLLIIDPKRNAFHALRDSPFLWRPLVFPDEQPAVEVLTELCEEMDRRYRIDEAADSFAQMAASSTDPLPRIVCVCDEYRDLISRSRTERQQIEEQIFRLGAKSRAAGIHLILATQRPSRETVRGALDANIPARVGLKMGKKLESQMLLGEAGAENLLGRGDLLFKDIGRSRRLQAPLLSEIG